MRPAFALCFLAMVMTACSPRVVDVRPYAGRPGQTIDRHDRVISWEHRVRATARYMHGRELDSIFRLPGPEKKTGNPFLYAPPQALERFVVFHMTIRNESEYDVFVDTGKIYLRDETGGTSKPVTKEELVKYWIGKVTIELGKPVTWSAQMESVERREETAKSRTETILSGGRIPPHGEHAGYVAFRDKAGTLKRANRIDPPDLLAYASLGGVGAAIGAPVGGAIAGMASSDRGTTGGAVGGVLGGAGSARRWGTIPTLVGGLVGGLTGGIVGLAAENAIGNEASGALGGTIGGAVGGFAGGMVGGIWGVLTAPPVEEKRLQVYVEIVTRASRYGNPLRMSLVEFSFDKVLVPARPVGDEELDPWRPLGD